MPNRTKTAASPIFAAFLASVFSTAIACAAARAADDCLSEPKHQTPPGGHWGGRRGLLLLHRSGLSPHTPCQSPGALTRVAACTLARSPYSVTRYPKASDISSPP